MDVREREGCIEILTMIEEPGEWDAKAGVYRRREVWKGLATEHALTTPLMVGDKLVGGGISVADALIAEGWRPPEHVEEDPELCQAFTPPGWGQRAAQCRRRAGHDAEHRAGGLRWTP